MSDADTTMAAAIKNAQARTGKSKAKASTKPATPTNAERARRFAKAANARPVITFETAAALCPTHEQAGNIARHFGIEDVDYHAIRETSEESIGRMARELEPVLVVSDFNGETNNKALEMHLQRIVGAFVGSAYGAASFYETKRQAARDLNSQFNQAREEDRLGVDGMANKAQRAREFAAQLGLKAFAVLAAADGALAAYEHVVGSPWQPYSGPQDNGAALAREAAQEQAAALGL